MKKFFLITSICWIVFAITGCKTDNTSTKIMRVAKIKQTVAATPTVNKEFTFTYNAAGKITRVDQAGSSPVNTFYYQYYYSTRLDSIYKIRTSDGALNSTVDVLWTGNNISVFNDHSYTYDGTGRLSIKTYSTGNILRYDYSTDSIRYFFTEVGLAEYLQGSYTLTTTYKNPFLVAGNEKESKVFGFVMNGIAGDLNTIKPYLMDYGRGYNEDGSLSYEIHYTSEGNTEGYPDKITITSGAISTIVLEFSYEEVL